MSQRLISSLELRKMSIYPLSIMVTHIQCRDLQEAIRLRPDEAFKRTYPLMWEDTYYVDPFKVSANALTSFTADSQVNQTQVDTVPTASGSEHPPVAGAQVSPHPKVRFNTTDTSTLATQSAKTPSLYCM